ncbi:hypothetical protein ABTM81_19685, partial [Acinetobacter baumannii]
MKTPCERAQRATICGDRQDLSEARIITHSVVHDWGNAETMRCEDHTNDICDANPQRYALPRQSPWHDAKRRTRL